MYIYIYIYTQANRGSQSSRASRSARRGAPPDLSLYISTVSFHNFKSQNFKLSVSNPKSKYVAYVSVLSQISNCQGLGRKNKHETLKTDRMYIFIVIP